MKNNGLIFCRVSTIIAFAISSVFATTPPTESTHTTSPVTTDASSKDVDKKVEEEVKKRMPKALEDHLKKFSPENFAVLSREILEKEELLKSREQELTLKQEQLKISEEQLAKKVMDFETRQQKFIGCVDRVEADQKTRVDKLVEVVANMRPQTAADLLAVQDPTLSVQILSKLDSTKSSKIFNLMNKEISAKLQKLYLDMKQ